MKEPAVPFGASVTPAVWSSSSLVFKLFPREASLPGGRQKWGESQRGDHKQETSTKAS